MRPMIWASVSSNIVSLEFSGDPKMIASIIMLL